MARTTARAPRQARRAAKRRPQRRRETRIAFEAIAIEGALLQPELISRIAQEPETPQRAAEYGLDPGEKLREVVQAKFAEAQSLHGRFLVSDRGPKPLARFVRDLLSRVLDFADLAEVAPIVIDERSFPIGHAALGGRVPIVLAPFEAIDKGDRAFGSDGRQRSPAQLLQEYLNASDGALWGLVCDGATLRLYRDNAALTRPAYIEADLAMLLDATAPRLSEFSALWLLMHASRFGAAGAPLSESPLERWREEGREKGAVARERLREGVEEALALLGRGLIAHPANAKLRDQLAKGEVSPQGYLDALLRLVYRLIFVFAAEDRDLLHTPRPEEPAAFEAWRAACDIYRRGYGLGRLRELSAKRASWDANVDGWEGIKVLFRELWRGQPALALPALGGLFAPGAVRDFGDCQLANRYFYEALFRLAWLRTDSGLERVNWHDMQTEELGSVYESLLELVPNLADPRGFGFIDVGGHERKTTASYYTPDPLVQALLDETLEPLIAERTKGKDGQAAIDALLDLRIIDPACGSGHFLLAAARRLAMRCAELANPGAAPSPVEHRHWLREVARRCLFGVDKNPMAVELAKVALWIETVEPGKPLSFLDAHIRCGDALLGIYDLGALQAGIPDEAYRPLTGDDRKAAAEWRKRNKAERDARSQGQFAFFEPPREVLEAARALEAQGEDKLADVEAKAERFRALMAGPDRYRMEVACELYCAAFLMPKTEGPPMRPDIEARWRAHQKGEELAAAALIPTSRDVWEKLQGSQPLSLLEQDAVKAAKAARAFHWPLEFPQVFFPGPGREPGFDLALGNPPWDRIKLQEQEFFAGRDARIALAANKAERQRLIEALAEAEEGSAERMLLEEFTQAKHEAEAASVFVRVDGENGGRFPLAGVGDVNTYALFSELFSTIARRAGMVVPTELASSDTTKAFFSDLVGSGRLRSLLDFQTGMGFFDRIGHARFKFALVALGEPRHVADPKFKVAFFLRTTAEMADKSRYFEMSASDIAAINPNTRTAPIFRSKADAELTRQIYARVPVLIDDGKGRDGNPWGIRFAAMFHMSNDSGLFRTAGQLTSDGLERDGRDWVGPDGAGRWLPLYEAKMIHHFDHRWATYEDGTGDKDSRNLEPAEKDDPDFEVAPRYWVPAREVYFRLTPLPKAFVEAMREENEELIALWLAHGLFGLWLRQAGFAYRPKDEHGVYGQWQDFVGRHPALREIAPKRLGLTGDAEPVMAPADGNFLPADPTDRIVSTGRERTAWYEVDRQALETMLRTAGEHCWLTEPAEPLRTTGDVLAFAEHLLEASCPKWLMGWRDICRATDERTVIAGAMPLSGVGHTSPIFFLDTTPERQAAFLSVLCSLVLDFVARQKVGGTHLTYGYLNQFPMPPPTAFTDADLAFIVPRVLELTYTSHAMKPFAEDLGYKGNAPFPWDEDRRALLRAELDARIARLYGLTRDQLRYILDPADVMGAGYPSETFRVLQKNERDKYGEYRTRRLVLEAWDRMQADGTFARLGSGDDSDALAVPTIVELPPLAGLPNGAWAWPASVQPRDRLRYAAQYALWQMDPASDGARMRFVIAGLAEPALLTPLLATGDRKQWVRLVGPEAQPTQGAVRLRPTLNAAWRSMFETLLASGQLEEHTDGTWGRGRDFSPAGLQAASTDAQRVAFVIRAVRDMDLGNLTAAVAADDNVIWARFGSGQAG